MSLVYLEVVLNWWFLIAVVMFVCAFAATVMYGIDLCIDKNPDVIFFKTQHRRYANIILFSLIFAVLPIEIQIQLGGFNDRSPELFWAHIFFVVPFLCILLLVRFKITGTNNLLLHITLVKVVIVLFIGVAITGCMLFFNVHPFLF